MSIQNRINHPPFVDDSLHPGERDEVVRHSQAGFHRRPHGKDHDLHQRLHVKVQRRQKELMRVDVDYTRIRDIHLYIEFPSITCTYTSISLCI